MITKGKIKVLKKGEIREAAAEPAAEIKPKQAAREMVANVTNWVTEFQNRKREETKIALEGFFKTPTQVS